MAEDQKDRYIQYLAEQNQDLRLTSDAMKLVLEDFMAQMKELKDQMLSIQSKHADLESRLSEEHKLRKSAERKIKSLQEKLDYANQERFGDRRQKIQSKAKTSDSDRRKEKDDYDGTDDTLRTDSVGNAHSQEVKEPSKKERDLSNRPDGYKTMGVAGETIEHTDFLGDAELKSIMSDGYNAYVFIGNELKSAQFKDTVHQVCMSHAKNKFVKASNQGSEPNAERFSEILKEFFMRERRYDDAGLTPKERLQERQSLETMELLIELRSLLDSELSRDSEFRSPYYTEALNYLNRFWKEIFAYLDDGELPIDNNLAERTIRKLTTQRNNSLHYGSDAGVEMAATYHSVIGTVKLHGSSIWNFIGTFFKNIFNGCRDYVNMVPDKITLATGQC